VNVYVDSSVLLRVVLNEPRALREWRRIRRPLASELIRLECRRTIDRARIRARLSDDAVAQHRAVVLEVLDTFDIVPLDSIILERAAEPFPTLLSSLDAIHLATALLARAQVEDLHFATHDGELATAARAAGFKVLGASRPFAIAKSGGSRGTRSSVISRR
jgi:predicted nucleic acid-binding protein